MDKVTPQVHNMLFEIFGLCPEYEVRWTDNEWIEYYRPPHINFKFGGGENDYYAYPNKVRLHLNEHKTILENGLCVSSFFAVDHASKAIFLRIIKVNGGESFGKVQAHYGG